MKDEIWILEGMQSEVVTDRLEGSLFSSGRG